MPTTIKICGIKTEEEICIINKFPVNYIGFIFAPSKRQVTEETVGVLRPLLRADIKAVGVFVDETVEHINHLVKSCNLQVVQLHGTESVDMCQQINAMVWKSISIKDQESLKDVKVYAPFVEALLLDTYSSGEKGGTGKTFNWDLIKDLTNQYPIILAGGLTPENVVEAIETVHPQTIDMNSGVETNLIKDQEKIAKVFRRLKEAKINE